MISGVAANFFNQATSTATRKRIKPNSEKILRKSEHLLAYLPSIGDIAVNVDKSITITGSQNNPNAHTKFVLCNFTATSNLILYAPESVTNKYFVNTQDGVTSTNSHPKGIEITGSDIGTARDYQIVVIAGTSNINVTMHPMIIPKDIFNAGFTDYQPYAMSNAELTAAIQALQAQLANQ